MIFPSYRLYIKVCIQFFCIPKSNPYTEAVKRPTRSEDSIKLRLCVFLANPEKSADFSFSLFVSLCCILGSDVARLTQSRQSRQHELPGSCCATVIFFPSFIFFFYAWRIFGQLMLMFRCHRANRKSLWFWEPILGSLPQKMWLFSPLILRLGARLLCWSKVAMANEMWRFFKMPGDVFIRPATPCKIRGRCFQKRAQRSLAESRFYPEITFRLRLNEQEKQKATSCFCLKVILTY